MANDPVVGIDLGTTYSCIAVKKNEKIEVIPNKEGDRTTLSYVYFGKNDVFVGKFARSESASNPLNGIYEIKRLIGCLHDDPDIESDKKFLTYDYVRGDNGEIKIKIFHEDEIVYKLPEEICARILYKLKIDAEAYLGKAIKKAVITVPAYFNNAQRAATRDAAKIAGLEVIKLINEPSSAALAYVTENNYQNGTILIYDLGGGTFDVSLIRIENRHLKVLSVSGDTHLGGQDFLNRLVGYCAKKIGEKHKTKIETNRRLMRRLIAKCEEAKLFLSCFEETKIILECFINGEDVELRITRTQFENLNKDLFDRTIAIVDGCIRNRRLSKSDVNEVLLVGGASRIPKIEALLKEYFVNRAVVKRNINADEVVAIGAAIQADHEEALSDVLPLSIGTVLDDEPITFYFARNTPLPAATQQTHEVLLNFKKKTVILSFYEGEHLDCNKNVLLAAQEIKWNSTKMSRRKINVIMQINTNGIINVTVQGNTIKTFSIVLNRGRLEDEEIEKIRQEFDYN